MNMILCVASKHWVGQL